MDCAFWTRLAVHVILARDGLYYSVLLCIVYCFAIVQFTLVYCYSWTGSVRPVRMQSQENNNLIHFKRDKLRERYLFIFKGKIDQTGMSYLFICYYRLIYSPFLQLKSNVWLAARQECLYRATQCSMKKTVFYYPSHSVSGSSKMMKLFSGRSVPISWPAQFRSMDSQMDSWTRQAGRLLARLTRSLGDVKSS